MILLLAGTSEARRLATALGADGVPAVASLAGATREPATLALPTRVGGFGGDEGFAAYLRDEGIAGVIDATHPFAARVTARTHDVCGRQRVPLLRVERAGWQRGPGDDWSEVADEHEAARLIPPEAVAFLATGRQSLPAWAGLRARAFLRVIDPPDRAFPLDGDWAVGRPPFDRAAEAETFRRLGITHLVVKDAGGTEGRAKLDAARDLGVRVLVIRRPPATAGLRIVRNVDEALDWAKGIAGPAAG